MIQENIYRHAANENMRFTILVLIFLQMYSHAARGDESIESDRKASLTKVAYEIKSAVLDNDISFIAGLVGKNGIVCGDSLIPKRQVINDLNNQGSWLASYLFWPKNFGSYTNDMYPMSMKEYFESVREISIDISFMMVKGVKQFDYACIRYKGAGSMYAPELCFFYSGQGWIFSNSPYSCS